MISWLRGLFTPKSKTAVPQASDESETGFRLVADEGPIAGEGIPSPREAILSGTASDGMRVRMLDLSGVAAPFRLPRGLQCFGLNLSHSSAGEIPDDVQVEYKIDLTGCAGITTLPAGLKTGSLVLNGCSHLRALPENLEVNFLNIEGCAALSEWPESARVDLGAINARGCVSLKALPKSLGPLTNLDLGGCRQLTSLPPGLKINGWLDIADTRIEGLPDSAQDVRLRWRGVSISARIAFFPETLTAEDILGERNAEVRRVMIERRGLETFIKEAQAKVLDEDTDPGGQRQLLRVPMKDDEDLVCVSLHCPSTGRHYIIRVPPTTVSCRQAVAWTAGFDNPDDYNPVVET